MGVVAYARSVAAFALGGCFQPGVYVCEGEGSCDAGTCEPSGFCSYPDADCDSGRRYSELAGDGLAGTCVDAADPSSSGSGSSSDGTTMAPVTSSDVGSTTEADLPPEVPPVCGDGNVDPGEACDDGNLEPADGCSPECVASGTIVWEQFHADPFGGDDAALALALLAPDEIVVAGRLQTASDTHVGLYARHAVSDGALAWANTYDDPDAPADMATGIVVNGSNDIIVAGGSGVYPNITSAWMRAVSPNGEALWTATPNLRVVGGLAANGGGAIAVGNGIVSTMPDVYGAVALAVRESDGAQLWRVAFPDASGFNAIARVSNDDNFVAAAVGSDMALVRGGEDGFVEVDRIVGRFGGDDRAQAVAVLGSAEAVALGGYVSTAAGPDWFLRAYDGEVAQRWTRSETKSPLAFSDEIEGVAFAPDGSIVVAGMLTRVDKDVWIARFDPDGEIVWERTLPEEGENAGDDTGRAIAFALDGGLVVVGERTREAGRDGWVAKLVP